MKIPASIENDSITVAVVSDLHIGEGARSPDLNPFAGDEQSDGFLAHFEALVSKLRHKPHALLVPGDISDIAHPAEYEHAAIVLKKIAKSLSVPDSRVFPIPGNHDLSWSLVQAIKRDNTRLGYKLRFEPAKRVDWLSKRFKSKAGQCLLTDPYVCVDETDHLLVARYNSAQDDLPDNTPHHGKILQEHVEALDVALQKYTDCQKYRIFSIHHHPIIYSDPRPNFPDFSTLVNAENLLSVLSKHNFDLVVHGHKHVPRFRSYAPNSMHLMPILCSGSFSKKLDTQWTGLTANQFHIIHLHKRDEKTGYVCGEVLSWAYHPEGWIESNSQWSGIRHRSPFGANMTKAQLANIFEDTFFPLLKQKQRLGWADIESATPHIRYIDFDLLEQTLKEYKVKWKAVLEFDSNQPENLSLVLV